MPELDETLELLHRDARTAPADLSAARARLMAELDAGSTVVPLRPRRTRRFALPVAAAVAGVVAVTVVVVQTGSSGPTAGPAGPSPLASATPGPSRNPTANWPDIKLMSAVQVLNRAADLSVGAVDQPVGPGQFRYVGEHTWVGRGVQTGDATGYTYLWEQQIDLWIPADAHDVWQENRKILNTGKFLGGSQPRSQSPEPDITDTDQGQWQGRCGDFFPKSKPAKKCDDPADWDSPAFYATLPHDPAALYAKLRALTAGRGSTPSAMFHFGIEILRAGQMPAGLRAQWYRALAKIPGMTILAAETNLDGRTGVALGLDDRHEIRQLIIDPVTGQFVGERSIAGAEPDEQWIKPGTELGASAITTAVTGRIGEVPAK
ncbi:putative RNA polymerase sigma (70) factor [Amycolatopsis camponoti]|uniref:Putative RNA polymerase sigma (70) factor n=1 Tax=Amycolatopsis camponoti TaxID=2606593 RepID=A0A6I8LTG1_9PSEU|nr:CU044_5270 family protein [Amycolatopsis camponoti]VVJ18756.1 putative RNA polymerase sigma (70) factor [Amycolatopsis camponoti]